MEPNLLAYFKFFFFKSSSAMFNSTYRSSKDNQYFRHARTHARTHKPLTLLHTRTDLLSPTLCMHGNSFDITLILMAIKNYTFNTYKWLSTVRLNRSIVCLFQIQRSTMSATKRTERNTWPRCRLEEKKTFWSICLRQREGRGGWGTLSCPNNDVLPLTLF